jgi:catechol 2,3-dioxygenase-like lactoylglutathione lyase family enzyme
MAETQSPRALSHVGLTVEDVEAAATWYEDVLGFQRLFGPERIERGEGHFGRLLDDGDAKFQWLSIVHLITGNHIGLELLEFDDTNGSADPTPPAPGLDHLCVVDPEVGALAETIAEHGGEHVKDVWTLYPEREYEMTYCRDPFGNRIEIHSHSYEQAHANISTYE